MHERISFIKHKGKPIMLIDFSECTAQEIIPILDEVKRQVAKHPHNSLLTLADYKNAQVDKAAATRIKEVLVFDRPYVKRSALVGTETLPKVFYENFKSFSQRNIPTFPTRDAAMEWLVGADSE
jgi:hypothetical protein